MTFRVIKGGGKGGRSPWEIEKEEKRLKELEICDECMHFSENNILFCSDRNKADCKHSQVFYGSCGDYHIKCEKKNWCCTFDHKTTKKKTCEYWLWRQL